LRDSLNVFVIVKFCDDLPSPDCVSNVDGNTFNTSADLRGNDKLGLCFKCAAEYTPKFNGPCLYFFYLYRCRPGYPTLFIMAPLSIETAEDNPPETSNQGYQHDCC
jgi:hypothetical protein